jgi:hypothetical protein
MLVNIAKKVNIYLPADHILKFDISVILHTAGVHAPGATHHASPARATAQDGGNGALRHE